MIWEVDEDCDGMIDWENFIQVPPPCPALLSSSSLPLCRSAPHNCTYDGPGEHVSIPSLFPPPSTSNLSSLLLLPSSQPLNPKPSLHHSSFDWERLASGLAPLLLAPPLSHALAFIHQRALPGEKNCPDGLCTPKPLHCD